MAQKLEVIFRHETHPTSIDMKHGECVSVWINKIEGKKPHPQSSVGLLHGVVSLADAEMLEQRLNLCGDIQFIHVEQKLPYADKCIQPLLKKTMKNTGLIESIFGD